MTRFLSSGYSSRKYGHFFPHLKVPSMGWGQGSQVRAPLVLWNSSRALWRILHILSLLLQTQLRVHSKDIQNQPVYLRIWPILGGRHKHRFELQSLGRVLLFLGNGRRWIRCQHSWIKRPQPHISHQNSSSHPVLALLQNNSRSIRWQSHQKQISSKTSNIKIQWKQNGHTNSFFK